jgi:hypothetical protein
MDRTLARQLIEDYMGSWLRQDLELFLSLLAEGIRVAECNGPVYQGRQEVRDWFTDWHQGPQQGRVTRWEISNFIFDERQNSAAVEWDFECVTEGNPGAFLGASLYAFAGDKIARIHEYMMEKKQFRPYAK